MTTGVSEIDHDTLARHLAEAEIRRVLHRYCRGIDRCDMALVRTCYHPDARDDHGDFVGGVDGFIEHCETNLSRFERTMHFLGNILIEPSPCLEKARSEAYLVAMHRLRANPRKPARDFSVGLRYVDDFAFREGEWRIANRVCVFEWNRIDPVPDGPFSFGTGDTLGLRSADDAVFAKDLGGLIEARMANSQ
jgi:SnoaL-like domain